MEKIRVCGFTSATSCSKSAVLLKGHNRFPGNLLCPLSRMADFEQEVADEIPEEARHLLILSYVWLLNIRFICRSTYTGVLAVCPTLLTVTVKGSPGSLTETL